MLIAIAKPVLRLDMILLGGRFIELGGPIRTFLEPGRAFMEESRQLELGIGIALIGGPAIPLRRLGLVDLDVIAACIGHGDGDLRVFVAGFGERQLLFERQGIERLRRRAERHQRNDAHASKGKPQFAYHVQTPGPHHWCKSDHKMCQQSDLAKTLEYCLS